MSTPASYILSIAFILCLSGGASAQQADNGNNKQAKQTTETTTTNATAAKKPINTPDKNTPEPAAEKSNWAIRIKQGEKWYQLSLELAF